MYNKHKLFASIFNIFSKSSIDKNQITFILDDNNSFKGNMKFIKEEFSNNGQFNFFYFNKNKPSFSSMKKLAKSKYIFLDDNFLAMAFMNFNKDTIITQLWHAPGAFKKFGASSSNNNEEISMINKASEKINYLITSSSSVSCFYEDAFRIDKSKIKPLGNSRIDYYFKEHNINKIRENFNKKYPQAINKKIILYAPTFREDEKFNNVFDFIDLEKFNKNLGENYILALRFHPKLKKSYKQDINSNINFIDLTDYENEQELLLISDILITDYSSIMIEYSLLKKPIFFFVYDFDSYSNSDRGFYFDYKNVPGKIVYNDDELIEAIISEDFEKDRITDFLNFQFDNFDGKSSKRIVDYILNKN